MSKIISTQLNHLLNTCTCNFRTLNVTHVIFRRHNPDHKTPFLHNAQYCSSSSNDSDNIKSSQNNRSPAKTDNIRVIWKNQEESKDKSESVNDSHNADFILNPEKHQTTKSTKTKRQLPSTAPTNIFDITHSYTFLNEHEFGHDIVNLAKQKPTPRPSGVSSRTGKSNDNIKSFKNIRTPDKTDRVRISLKNQGVFTDTSKSINDLHKAASTHISEIQQFKKTKPLLPPIAPTNLFDTGYSITPLSEHEFGLDIVNLAKQKSAQNPSGASSPAGKSDGPSSMDDDSSSKKKPKAPKLCKHGLENLSQMDCFRRVHFSMKLLFILESEPDILNNILFTDECNFNLPKLPPPLIKKPPIAQSELLPQIAWCGMTSRGAIGPYFFNSFVTDKTYIKMLKNYLLPELERKGFNVNNIWFQQDGAPWHRSKPVIDFLRSVFDYRIISLGSNFIWPPRSQDLTSMDYFFWDHIKDRLNFKHSKYDLCFQAGFRDIMTKEVEDVKVSALKKAIYQLPLRLSMCVNSNGDRFFDKLAKDGIKSDVFGRMEGKTKASLYQREVPEIVSQGNKPTAK